LTSTHTNTQMQTQIPTFMYTNLTHTLYVYTHTTTHISPHTYTHLSQHTHTHTHHSQQSFIFAVPQDGVGLVGKILHLPSSFSHPTELTELTPSLSFAFGHKVTIPENHTLPTNTMYPSKSPPPHPFHTHAHPHTRPPPHTPTHPAHQHTTT